VEENGLRTQVWRTDYADSEAMLRLREDLLPRGLRPDGVHFATSPLHSPSDFAALLEARGVSLLGHEVYTHNNERVGAETVAEVVGSASYFSPNAFEAECLLKSATMQAGEPWETPSSSAPLDLAKARRLALTLSQNHGQQNILLRCGSLGAILTGKDVTARGSALHVPAFFPSVLDSTGCGNTFAGAFQAAILSSGDFVHALAVASSAASIMGEFAGEKTLSNTVCVYKMLSQ
jgi:sugar/nucleoside kinase (ribokinase family)